MSPLLLSLLAASPAEAHKPTFGPGYDSPDDAMVLEDPDVSIVLYREITCQSPEAWITFDAEPGYVAWVQLGVPEIDRLEDYRPSMALIAPGLPTDVDVPFALPEGTGAVVFDTADVDEPDAFYEGFTQTSSWVLAEDEVELPEGGPAWLVGWHPEGQTGKLWLAVGTVEDFSDVEVEEFAGWSEQVHAFHETGRFEDPPEVEEQVCDETAGDTGAAAAADATGGAGCDLTRTDLVGLWAALFPGLVLLRRRRHGLPG